MLTRIISFAAALFSALMSVFGCYVDIPSTPLNKNGYTLVFDDEFDSAGLDSSKWLSEYLPHASDMTEGCKANYEIKDGCLNLIIDENSSDYACYTSMKVSSIQTFEKNGLHPGARQMRDVEAFNGFSCKYGYFEMRAKLPDCGGGGHVAWWLTGIQDDTDTTDSAHTGEIDIIENWLSTPNTFSPRVHPWNDEKLSEFGKDVKLSGDFVNNYHIYALDWTPKHLKFYVDGRLIAKTDNSPDYEMCMYLGVYTDCDWDGGRDNGVHPKTFSVDYVRVYQK